MLGSRAFRGIGLAFSVGVLWSATASAEVPDGSGAGGARWKDAIVRITVDDSVSKMNEAAFEAVIGAISVWQEADPYLPTLIVEKTDSPHDVGFDSKGNNQNTVVYMPKGAPVAKGALAITIITFDQSSGRVLDADIVVNGDHQFGVAETMSAKSVHAAYDLQNVLTHEFGHFLGLGEEFKQQTATMYAYSLPGETEKRDLDATDEDKIGSLYIDAPDTEEASATCAATVAKGARTPHGWWIAAAGAFGVALLARRRAWRTMTASSLGLLCVLATSVAGMDVAQVDVHALEAHWEDGIIVTTAELRPVACTECSVQTVQIFGGTVDGVSQQVGLMRPLSVGEHANVTMGVQGTAGRHGLTVLPIKE